VIPSRVTATNRRLDIQGLRAIAVIMVVAFHARLPVPGGFVGVDVFFVISGFVITAMLHRERINTGRIRFGQFYLKRFKRLTPALALVVTVTMIASAIILSRMGHQQIAAQTGVGAMLLVANFVISRTTGGYFDPAAETNPLLNTWSLSVEEQFYLVFPAVIAFGWYVAQRKARLRNAPFGLISGIAILSFGLALAGSFGWTFRGAGTLLGFYSPFTRAWEFAVGALLALALTKVTLSLSSRFILMMAVVGIGMLAASLWLITEATIFPGLWTLLPVTGTLLLLLAGTHQNPVSGALSSRPMVKIGDWSYSIYLWHWPFIVFAIYLWPISPYAAIIAAVVSLAPALASYYWMEQSIRQSVTRNRIQVTQLITIVMIPPLLLAALLGVAAKFYWQPQYESGVKTGLYDGDVRELDYEFWNYSRGPFYPCDDGASNVLVYIDGPDIEPCAQSKPDAPIDIAIVGDSHAAHLFYGLAKALADKNVGYFTLVGKPPIDDGTVDSRILEQLAQDPSIKTVIFNANWLVYPEVTESELTQTLLMFEASGKRIFITDGIPQFPISAFDCKYPHFFIALNNRCGLDINFFTSNYATYFPLIEKVLNRVPNAHLLSTFKYFCTAKSCDMTRNGELLYGDGGHLNHQGSVYLAEQLLKDDAEFKKGLNSKSTIRSIR